MDNKNLKSKLVAGGLLVSVLAYSSPIFAYTKDETVYTKLNSKGEEYQTTVSTYLENDKNENVLEDLTTLLNIQNTNGNETYEQDGNKLIWQANGNDIYYQGDTNKELPITCKVKYSLNGKEISAEELAGKSGKVTIDISYTNHEKHIVQINGTNTTLYTPFLVMTGTVINNEANRNISISNGKVIKDGNKAIIVGMAMPGMQESLGISKNKVSLPDSIKISMDATDFELGNIITIITPRILEEEDTDLLEQLDDVYNKVTMLQNSSTQIEQGSKELKKGINDAYKGSNTIKNEVDKQIKALKNQKIENTLDNSTLESIKKQAINGATLSQKELSVIAMQASKNASLSNEDLNEIATTALSNVGKIELDEKTQNEISAQVNKMITSEPYISMIKTEAKNQVDTLLQGISSQLKVTPEQIIYLSGNQVNKDVATTISTNLNKAFATKLESAKQTIYATAEKASIENAKIIASKAAISAGNVIANQTAQQVTTKVAMETAKQLAPKVAGETAKVVANTTAKEVAGAVSTKIAANVADNVKTQATKQVATSMTELSNGLGELNKGLSKLDNGSDKLSKGIHTFNTNGITPIYNYVNVELKNLTNRAEKLIQFSEEYQTFTELKDGEIGNTKFIMMTDSIKKKDEEKAIITDSYKIENKEENEESK